MQATCCGYFSNLSSALLLVCRLIEQKSSKMTGASIGKALILRASLHQASHERRPLKILAASEGRKMVDEASVSNRIEECIIMGSKLLITEARPVENQLPPHCGRSNYCGRGGCGGADDQPGTHEYALVGTSISKRLPGLNAEAASFIASVAGFHGATFRDNAVVNTGWGLYADTFLACGDVARNGSQACGDVARNGYFPSCICSRGASGAGSHAGLGLESKSRWVWRLINAPASCFSSPWT